MTEIVERWREYFQQLLDIQSGTEEENFTFHSVDIRIPTQKLQNAITYFEDHTAQGNDVRNRELLKKGGNVVHQEIYTMILKIREQQGIL